MTVIIIENENFLMHRIGGISSYIRSSIAMEHEVEFVCIGNGFAGSEKQGKATFISVGKRKMSNLQFWFRLFFIRLDKYMTVSTIIHLHHPYMCLPFLRYRKKIKLVLSLHSRQDESYLQKRNPIGGWLYKFLTRISIPKYDMIISSGTELLRYYQQRYHINHIPAEIIPVPVDSNVFFPADRLVVREKLGIDAGVKIVLYAGRFEKVKNLDLLLETFRLLQMQLENAVLWLVGEGEEKSYLQKKAAKLVLTNVKFFNTLSSVQLAEFMNAADVLAVTSLHESGPLVVKEALACNLPVVSVDVGDVMEVVRDLEGCLVVGYEKREFAEGLEKVIGLGIRSGLRGRVEKFGVDEFGRKLGIVYGEVIGGG